MPLYEFACDGCGRLVELLIRGDDQPACPNCGSVDLQRQLSVVAAHVAAGRSAFSACETPIPGGCGLPQCGAGGCQFD